MRIRFKPWAREELEKSKFYIDNPQEYREKWKSLFENVEKKESQKAPIHLELGCGKGNFIANLAVQNKNVQYIAIDMVDAMLGLAKRKIEEVYEQEEQEINNVYLTRFDIERILDILGPKDEIERIYINFCNPWPKGKHRKKRLTHRRQLEKYRVFLKEEGEIYFKTDDDDLFSDTLIYLQDSGFEIIKKTYDLEKEENFWNNIQTEHEKMFTEQGIKIKAVIARKKNV